MNDEAGVLVPLREQTVLFYEDEIPAAIVLEKETGEREVYVPLRPLCDFLGVNFRSQRRRVDRDLVLSRFVREVKMETAGGPQAMPCLPLDFLNGWLFGISANAVKDDETRGRVLRYQEECYRVLARHFQQTRVPEAGPATGLAQVEQMGLAIARMAREQMEFDGRLSGTEQQIEDVTQRLVALEDRVAPGQPVTGEQASQISQAVKAIALALGKKTGRNEFGAVYGELYRRFGITSYKLLPAGRFAEAMAFLNEWYQGLGGEVPF